MAFLLGYEYDIFISYRHNDNRSGWVTEFVKALQEELASTIKEPIPVFRQARSARQSFHSINGPKETTINRSAIEQALLLLCVAPKNKLKRNNEN